MGLRPSQFVDRRDCRDSRQVGRVNYADQLAARQGAGWKRYAPNPYRWLLRHLDLGRVLEIGCGNGRLLGYLGGYGVGIDNDERAIELANANGFSAYVAATPSDLTHDIGHFDALLCAHVLEHLDGAHQADLLEPWLELLRADAKIVLICPQERGYATDATHRTFTDVGDLERIAYQLGADVRRSRSFPLPRAAGKLFAYNESVVVATITAN
jgi:2-polyprenyl-3-methyl-5-hydroxy-6-metoxy-1,4-benzoquinol methylase